MGFLSQVYGSGLRSDLLYGLSVLQTRCLTGCDLSSARQNEVVIRKLEKIEMRKFRIFSGLSSINWLHLILTLLGNSVCSSRYRILPMLAFAMLNFHPVHLWFLPFRALLWCRGSFWVFAPAFRYWPDKDCNIWSVTRWRCGHSSCQSATLQQAGVMFDHWEYLHISATYSTAPLWFSYSTDYSRLVL